MINADPIRWAIGMSQYADGEYVSYHDYAILLAEAERLRAALAKREEAPVKESLTTVQAEEADLIDRMSDMLENLASLIHNRDIAALQFVDGAMSMSLEGKYLLAARGVEQSAKREAVADGVTTDDLSKSIAAWATEHTPTREVLAYKDGWINCRNAHIARAATQPKKNGCALVVTEGVVSIDRDFEYDYSTRLHTPKVVVRFAPGNGESGETWEGRDTFARTLSLAAGLLSTKEGE